MELTWSWAAWLLSYRHQGAMGGFLGRSADSSLKLERMGEDLGSELRPLEVPAPREAPDGTGANCLGLSTPHLPPAFDGDIDDRLKGYICDI